MAVVDNDDIRHARYTGTTIDYDGWVITYGGIRTPFNRFFEFAVWFAYRGDGRVHYATTGGNAGTITKVDESFNWYPDNGVNLLILSAKDKVTEIDAAARRLVEYLDNLGEKGKSGG